MLRILLTSLCLLGFNYCFAQGIGQDTPQPTTSLPTTDTMGIINQVDKKPEFPGGLGQLSKFLRDNLQYPEIAAENEVSGRVNVEFIVCEDGTLCNEKIVRGLGFGCDQEVIRVLKKMPKWTPAEKDGKKVKTRFILPVTFALQ